MQNEKFEGRKITYTALEDVKGGDLVEFADMVAVAATDIAAGSTGTCQTEGVFLLPKAAGVVPQGQALYLGHEGALTPTDSTDAPLLRVGVAWAAATAGDAQVLVKINV